MIVSHKYKFVIAVPVGLNAGPWLNRIAAEGDVGYLEVVGMPNGVCVPEGAETYARYMVDAPHHRLPQMWQSRKGTPWEGPADVQAKVGDWLQWYMWHMRREFLERGVMATPNGWGMRGEDGEWCYFEHPRILKRVLSGQGNSPKGEDAPWGVAEVKMLKMEEYSRGWRDLIKLVRAGGTAAKLPPEFRSTSELLRWHIPAMNAFYEVSNELADAFFKENAWETRE